MRRRLVLTAPRVYLRPPLDRDWRDWSLLRARSRKFLERWEPTWAEDAVSRAAYQNRLDFYRRLARRGSGLALHIFRREDDALVGGLTLNNIRRGIVQSCNVGYWIGEEYAHRGYMTEALAATIAYVFDQLRLHRLEAACLPENERSRGPAAQARLSGGRSRAGLSEDKRRMARSCAVCTGGRRLARHAGQCGHAATGKHCSRHLCR